MLFFVGYVTPSHTKPLIRNKLNFLPPISVGSVQLRILTHSFVLYDVVISCQLSLRVRNVVIILSYISIMCTAELQMKQEKILSLLATSFSLTFKQIITLSATSFLVYNQTLPNSMPYNNTTPSIMNPGFRYMTYWMAPISYWQPSYYFWRRCMHYASLQPIPDIYTAYSIPLFRKSPPSADVPYIVPAWEKLDDFGKKECLAVDCTLYW